MSAACRPFSSMHPRPCSAYASPPIIDTSFGRLSPYSGAEGDLEVVQTALCSCTVASFSFFIESPNMAPVSGTDAWQENGPLSKMQLSREDDSPVSCTAAQPESRHKAARATITNVLKQSPHPKAQKRGKPAEAFQFPSAVRLLGEDDELYLPFFRFLNCCLYFLVRPQELVYDHQGFHCR